MDLSIIIVNYNSKQKVFNCLNSIFSDNYLSGINYEIIVIDNNSNDNIAEEIKRNYPSIIFIRSEKNLGMGGGNNIGIRMSNGKYVLVLNPDTIIKKDAISKLFNYINNNKEIGLVGPKLLNSDLSIQYSCRRFPKIMTPILRRTFLGFFGEKHVSRYLMKDFSHKETKNVDWLLGACFMGKTELLKNILDGFDDKNFFMYFEDVDLCRRIWQSGHKVVYFPEAVVIHDHARESVGRISIVSVIKNKLAREHIKSWIKYLWKWKGKR
jgi:GT2 family glycosyltransferase